MPTSNFLRKRDKARSGYKGSPPHETLKSVVLDKNYIKGIGKLNQFCHTGILEVYHSLLLKYCPKRLHFGYKGMIAQTQLAALDHNNNVDRSQLQQPINKRGAKLSFLKSKKQ